MNRREGTRYTLETLSSGPNLYNADSNDRRRSNAFALIKKDFEPTVQTKSLARVLQIPAMPTYCLEGWGVTSQSQISETCTNYTEAITLSLLK